MRVRSSSVCAIVGAVLVGILGTAPAVSASAMPRADLSVTRISPSTTTAVLGQLVTFRAVAVNNGPAASDFNVGAVESQGLRLVSLVCANGVSPDTPDCEYGSVPPGTRLVTKIVVRVVNQQALYDEVACTTSNGDTIDPKPGNDCKLALLALK